jgi:hypothetical protein
MRYLPDVNALVALGFFEHAFHSRVASWVGRLKSHAGGELLTCSITETGRLPAWAKTARQTTEGHLAELALAHDAALATLAERIPGAFLIPL